jgi:hypothetical protein
MRLVHVGLLCVRQPRLADVRTEVLAAIAWRSSHAQKYFSSDQRVRMGLEQYDHRCCSAGSKAQSEGVPTAVEFAIIPSCDESG